MGLTFPASYKVHTSPMSQHAYIHAPCIECTYIMSSLNFQ